MNKKIYIIFILLVVMGAYFFKNQRFDLDQTLQAIRTPPFQANVDAHTLSSDIPLWFCKNSQEIVSLRLSFSGSGDSVWDTQHAGIGDFTASMLMEGCGDQNADAFITTLNQNHIQLHIQSDLDHFTISLRTTSKNFEKAIDLLITLLTKPRFEQTDMDRIRKLALAKLAHDQKQPETFAREIMQDILYAPGHPYGRKLTDYQTYYKKIQSDDLRTFIKNYLTQERLHITACGDISIERLKSTLEKFIMQMPHGEKSNDEKESFYKTGERRTHTMDIPQSLILLTHPGLSQQDPDFLPLHVGLFILGGGSFSSRLFNEIRERRGLAYNISCGSFAHSKIAGIRGITSTKTESAKDVEAHIVRIFEEIKEKGITQEELSHTTENLCNTFQMSFTSTENITSLLMYLMQAGFDIDYLKKRSALFQALTKERVNTALQKYLDPKKLNFVIVGR